jgi:serine/threonine protein phosphatase PrpC
MKNTKFLSLMLALTVGFFQANQVVGAEVEVSQILSGTHSRDGRAREDRLTLLTAVPGTSIKVAGVFDGHGGKQASIFASDNLVGELGQAMEQAGGNVLDAFPLCFESMNQKIGAAGTTATVVAFDENGKATVAYVGDSTATWMCLDGSAGFTTDHKAYLESVDVGGRLEAKNIYKVRQGTRYKAVYTPDQEWVVQEVEVTVGGRIISEEWNPEQFSLDVSRALGDEDFRKIGFPMISTPDIKILPDNWRILIIASDGLWDGMTYQSALQFVQSKIVQAGEAIDEALLNEIAQTLAEQARLAWQRCSPEKRIDDTTVQVFVNPSAL